MSGTDGELPDGFAALEPFVKQWALETAGQRADMRGAASEAERQAFYAAASTLVEPALAALDARPLAGQTEPEKRLMRMMLSLAHVAMAVEVHKDQEPRHARFREHMPVTAAPADI